MNTIIGCAIKVHRALGPGLLESTCEKCTAYELRRAGCEADEERALPLVYGEVRLECGYRLDMVVDELVIVEVKAVERLDQRRRGQRWHSTVADSYRRRREGLGTPS
jgi:GxxExxY protein